MIEVDYSKMASFVGNVSVLYLFVALLNGDT